MSKLNCIHCSFKHQAPFERCSMCEKVQYTSGDFAAFVKGGKTARRILLEGGTLPAPSALQPFQPSSPPVVMPTHLPSTSSSSPSSSPSARPSFSPPLVCVVNVDAHLDVRPTLMPGCRPTSGSPFFQLLSDPRFYEQRCVGAPATNANNANTATTNATTATTILPFVEFGCQGSQCSSEHAHFVSSRGGHIVWLRSDLRPPSSVFSCVSSSFELQLSRLSSLRLSSSPSSAVTASLFVSFDLDVVAGRDAPGVSCSSSAGLTPDEAFDIARIAGRNKDVRLFDLSEYNPEIEEYRTGKLCAEIFYYFALGFAEKLKDKNEVKAADASCPPSAKAATKEGA